jgi:hypothetical protein
MDNLVWVLCASAPAFLALCLAQIALASSLRPIYLSWVYLVSPLAIVTSIIALVIAHRCQLPVSQQIVAIVLNTAGILVCAKPAFWVILNLIFGGFSTT